VLTLLLLRHAKSTWDDPELEDYDRGLATRGLKAAPRMGRYIATQHLKPDLVLCSGAVRTRATLALVLPELGSPPPRIRYDNALYLAGPDVLLDAIGKAGTSPRVMLVGHNPGIHALALALTGGGDKAALAELATRYPTAALAVLTFPAAAWKDVAPATGRLERFVTPRGLKE
jgi:phosphohistidine phosphatase